MKNTCLIPSLAFLLVLGGCSASSAKTPDISSYSVDELLEKGNSYAEQQEYMLAERAYFQVLRKDEANTEAKEGLSALYKTLGMEEESQTILAWHTDDQSSDEAEPEQEQEEDTSGILFPMSKDALEEKLPEQAKISYLETLLCFFDEYTGGTLDYYQEDETRLLSIVYQIMMGQDTCFPIFTHRSDYQNTAYVSEVDAMLSIVTDYRILSDPALMPDGGSGNLYVDGEWLVCIPAMGSAWGEAEIQDIQGNSQEANVYYHFLMYDITGGIKKETDKKAVLQKGEDGYFHLTSISDL